MEQAGASDPVGSPRQVRRTIESSPGRDRVAPRAHFVGQADRSRARPRPGKTQHTRVNVTLVDLQACGATQPRLPLPWGEPVRRW
jgi:hypothetical protein